MSKDNAFSLKKTLLYFSIYIGLYIMIVFLIVMITLEMDIKEGSAFSFFLENILTPTISIILLAYIFLKKMKLSWREFSGTNNNLLTIYLFSSLLIIGVMLFAIVLGNFTNTFFPIDKGNDRFDEKIIYGTFYDFILVFIYFAILGPISEEILFRGILLRGLLNKISIGKSIFLSAAIFALVHFNIYQSLTTFLAGIIFAWLFIKTNSLYLVIYLHLLNNGLAVLLVKGMIFSPAIKTILLGGVGSQTCWLFLFGLGLSVIAIINLNNLFSKRKSGKLSLDV